MPDKRAYAAERFKERSESKRFKLPEGISTVRILPNPAGPDEPEFYEYAMHGQVGPRKAYVRCGKSVPRPKLSEKCWLCDSIIAKAEASENSSKRAIAKDVRRKECFGVQVSMIDNDKWSSPKFWEVPNTVAKQLLAQMAKKNISDPKAGYNFSISREGTDLKTKYGSLMRDDDPSVVPATVMSAIRPFEQCVNAYDEAGMKAAYYGHEQSQAPVEPEDDGGFDESPVELGDELTPQTADDGSDYAEEEAVAATTEDDESYESEEDAPLDDESAEDVDAEIPGLTEDEPEEDEFYEQVEEVEEEPEPPKPAPRIVRPAPKVVAKPAPAPAKAPIAKRPAPKPAPRVVPKGKAKR